MPEKKIKWTTQQSDAINAVEGPVLVTASAGTGKTAVLTARCAHLASQTELSAGITDMLVLTYTDAAAEEMRSRILQQMRIACTENDSPHLRRQLALVHAADICTVHAFCRRIILQHFHELGIDPACRILNTDEQTLLKTEVLEEVIDWMWEQPAYAQSMSLLFGDRGFRGLKNFPNFIIEISKKLDTLPHHQQWFENAKDAQKKNHLLDLQLQNLNEQLTTILKRFEFIENVYSQTAQKPDWLQKYRNEFVSFVEQTQQLVQNKNIRQAADLIEIFQSKNLNAKNPKLDCEDTSSMLQTMLKSAMSDFKALSDALLFNPDYVALVEKSASPQVDALLELVRKFREIYSQIKTNLNCHDFADLEHLALKLLADPKDNSKPSTVALSLREQYKFILVDEYQDINPVQEQILKFLSSGENLFFVGDVKQCIYAFRGAEPGIFLNRLQQLPPKRTSTGACRIDLNTNFRSKHALLNFANALFDRVMKKCIVGFDYDESAHLKPPKKDPNSKPAVELHILDAESAKDNRDYNERKIQAAFVAKRIREIVGADSGKPEFEIYDKSLDANRPVQYSDITILMRSLANTANDYVEVLQQANIPVSCKASAGYFQATEIRDMICLLKVLDNPCRDIELAAVLRSPFFRFDETQLAAVALHARSNKNSSPFYRQLKQYLADETENTLAEKIRLTLQTLADWRRKSRTGTLADLIWHIYSVTQYSAFVSALPRGRTRVANLLRLHSRAIEFESFISSKGHANLTRFVEFVEKLHENQRDWQESGALNELENAVRITSIHQSKGLEFPVVILAELENKFRTKDQNQQVVFDPEIGLGLQAVEPKTNTRLLSVPCETIAQKMHRTMQAEEMRILYVAVTRARERLLLVGTQTEKASRNILLQANLLKNKTLPDWMLRDAHSHLDWILLGLANEPSLCESFGIENVSSNVSLMQTAFHDKFDSALQMLKPVKKQKTQTGKTKQKSKTTDSEIDAIKKNLEFRYPFDTLTSLPAKASVTTINHLADEFQLRDTAAEMKRKPKALFEDTSRKNPNAAQKGTAAHLLLSSLDWKAPVTKNTIEQTLDSLVDAQSITTELARAIDLDSILQFFDSKIARQIQQPQNRIFREWMFTYALPAEQWQQLEGIEVEKLQTADEFIVVQGRIDLLVETPDGLIVLDFKTDTISKDQASQRAQSYRRQLDLYANAAEGVKNKKVFEKYLYFLNGNQTVKL